MLQLGIIGEIDKVEDEIVRSYSFIGYCVSTSAEVEHMLFNCYYAAGDLSKKEAAEKFYKSDRFGDKYKLANTAVRTLFSGSAAKSTWDDIISKIDNLSGAKGSRNVFAHNPLMMNLYVNDKDTDAPYLMELAVSRNRNEAEVKNRALKTENLASIRSYSYDLCGANMQLSHFFDTYLKTRWKEEE